MRKPLILRSLILSTALLLATPAAAQKKIPGSPPAQGKLASPASPPKSPTGSPAHPVTDATPASKPALVLLPLEGKPSILTLDAELTQAIKTVGQHVQRSSLPLDDLMLAVGCATNNISCLQKIGESINASGMILGTTRQAEEGLELTLRWFDVTSGGDSGRALRILPDQANARAELLLDAVKELFLIKDQHQLTTENTGSIKISATAPNVEVIVDNQPRGTLPLEMRNIEEGTYSIEAHAEGYITWRGTAEIRTNQMTHLSIEMVPSPYTQRSISYVDAIRTRTLIIGGLGLASLAAAIAVGTNMNTTQNSFDKITPVTPAQISEMKELQQSGERDALAANILLGIGSVALVTSALLSYLDYRRTLPPENVSSATKLHLGPASVRLNLSF